MHGKSGPQVRGARPERGGRIGSARAELYTRRGPQSALSDSGARCSVGVCCSNLGALAGGRRPDCGQGERHSAWRAGRLEARAQRLRTPRRSDGRGTRRGDPRDVTRGSAPRISTHRLGRRASRPCGERRHDSHAVLPQCGGPQRWRPAIAVLRRPEDREYLRSRPAPRAVGGAAGQGAPRGAPRAGEARRGPDGPGPRAGSIRAGWTEGPSPGVGEGSKYFIFLHLNMK